MSKNIVVFSDGTGQRGGVTFDENRTNIYKLYRATRCGPDSGIDPALQLTYYDPGLGTVPEGSGIIGGLLRKIHNLISQATGLGITMNIVDCYAEIIRIFEPGDRIYVFGFSRGAYTVRCLTAVLCFCGVPTRMRDGSPLKRDSTSLRNIAKDAVYNVYQHVGSPKDSKYVEQRKVIAARFRGEHGSEVGDGGNANPYFVGVFDTVAAIASYPALAGIAAAIVVLFVFFSNKNKQKHSEIQNILRGYQCALLNRRFLFINSTPFSIPYGDNGNISNSWLNLTIVLEFRQKRSSVGFNQIMR